jgi:hypothetical protein
MTLTSSMLTALGLVQTKNGIWLRALETMRAS